MEHSNMVQDSILLSIDEIDDAATLDSLVATGSRPLRSLWGTAPTGPFHLGYLTSILQQQKLIAAGFDHIIILADLHAHLDREKVPWVLQDTEEISRKTQYYASCLEAFGLGPQEVHHVIGHELHLDPDYIKVLLRLSGKADLIDIWRATIGTTKMIGMPKVAEIIYTLTQILDIRYLNVDAVLSGMDEAPIYRYARTLLMNQEYRHTFVGLYQPTCPGILGREMHASDAENLIAVHDSAEVLRQKITTAYIPSTLDREDNLLAFIIREVMFRSLHRPLKVRGQLFTTWSSIQNAYSSGILDIPCLREVVADFLVDYLAPVRKYFTQRLDMIEQSQGITYRVYP